MYELAKAMGIPPNKVMVSALIKAAARAGQLNVAIGVLAEAKELGVKIDKKTMDNFIQVSSTVVNIQSTLGNI